MIIPGVHQVYINISDNDVGDVSVTVAQQTQKLR